MKKKLSDKKKLQLFYNQQKELKTKINPTCRHFSICGGCELQDISYQDQLDIKIKAFKFIIEDVLEEYKSKTESQEEAQKIEEIKNNIQKQEIKIVPSQKEYGYRQRMDYVYAFNKAGLRKAKSSRYVVELEECPLIGEKAFLLFQKAVEMAKNLDLKSHNYLKHTGELRYFVIRKTRNDNFLISLVTKSTDCEESIEKIAKELINKNLAETVYWLVAEGLTDTSFGDVKKYYGKKYIEEEMLGIKMKIAANNFFQANPQVAEMAYQEIQNMVKNNQNDFVLDMYSGTATIALIIAKHVKNIIAAENNPENVEIAKINIKENNCENIKIELQDATEYLNSCANQKIDKPETIILNPPRPGIDKKAIEAIRNIQPINIIYLSCNPFSLIKNITEVSDIYNIEYIKIFDMFPQTKHFETLVLLKKAERKS